MSNQRRYFYTLVLTTLAVMVTGGGQVTGASVGRDYFRGRTITVVVNFGVGGATDIFARAVVPYLQKHIPGNPTVIVQNMPGAGGITGTSWLYSAARKDGTFMGVFTAPFSDQVLSEVQYDARHFYWLGGIAEAAVSYYHRSLGITSPEKLVSTKTGIVMGGFGPSSSKDLSQRTFFEMVGINYRYVTGYSSNADLLAATLRGEINFSQVSLTSWFASFQEHVGSEALYPAYQTGILDATGMIVRDPRVRDLPTGLELAELLRGPEVRQSLTYRANSLVEALQGAMLRVMVLPPGVSDNVGVLLRQAVADTFADPEFIRAYEQQNGLRPVFIPGDQADVIARRIIEGASPDVVGYLKRIQQERR